MITGISANGYTSNSLVNAPLTPVAVPHGSSPVGASPIGLSLPFFDSFGGAYSGGLSWIGDLSQIVSQVEEFIFGFDAQSSSKQALQSMLSFTSEILSGLTSGPPENARPEAFDSARNGTFQVLFPYADLSLLPPATSGDAQKSSGKLLDLLASGGTDAQADFSRSDPMKNGNNSQLSPAPTNPLLFRTPQQTENQRARGGADPARPIPWEERKKRQESRRRDSVIGRALSRLQNSLLKLVKSVGDALS